MLLELSGHERHKHERHFREMFHHRKLVFHDQKQWDVGVVDGLYEIDEFDRDDTCYLMSFDRQGRLVGSLRLISTAMPHMMSGPFLKMFPDIAFKSPVIWEVTRFVVVGDREIQPNQVSRAACELLLGTCQFGLTHGVKQMTSVYEAGMLRLYRRCGLPNPEMARHRSEHHGLISAGLWDISEALEASIIKATGLGKPGTAQPATQAA